MLHICMIHMSVRWRTRHRCRGPCTTTSHDVSKFITTYHNISHFGMHVYIIIYKLYVYIYIHAEDRKLLRKTRKSNFPWTWRSRSLVSSMTLGGNTQWLFTESEFLAFLEFTEESTSEWLPHLSFTAGMSQTLSQSLHLWLVFYRLGR